MIEVLPSPPNVAAFRLLGTVTADDFDAFIAVVETKLDENAEIGVYVDATEFEDMTGEAIVKRAQFALTRLKDLGRFRRAGMVTDRPRLAFATGLAGRFLPHLETRTFRPDEKDDALHWVALVAEA